MRSVFLGYVLFLGFVIGCCAFVHGLSRPPTKAYVATTTESEMTQSLPRNDISYLFMLKTELAVNKLVTKLIVRRFTFAVKLSDIENFRATTTYIQ